MTRRQPAKILFTKTDIADILGVTLGVFRQTAQFLNVENIEWTNRNQRFTDSQVHEIIKAIRKRLTDAEIDALINQKAGYLPVLDAVLP
jgi:DNA topoisomerase VI subunit A